ncbi:hypothetical protein SAMN04487996_107263 [Dyadobacter soli]|uniref:Uncharacterized protein n=1 Tax=Dyadobacter soli TaxID=659014 RepID=A0A1G7GI62_9BACT|nr:hypothetical protein [Dyadobacter soli]SDE87810.1 hypothetical protein SAMN04487996_107263 [Dyadobacter soli]
MSKNKGAETKPTMALKPIDAGTAGRLAVRRSVDPGIGVYVVDDLKMSSPLTHKLPVRKVAIKGKQMDDSVKSVDNYSRFIDHIIESQKDESDLIEWSLSRFANAE